MKRVLYLMLKNIPRAYETLEEIREKGFNGTVINSESLKAALDYYPEEHHFYTLRNFENKESRESKESVYCLFVIDDEKTETLKNIIRDCTDNFKEIKGFMFSRPIDDYEGAV